MYINNNVCVTLYSLTKVMSGFHTLSADSRIFVRSSYSLEFQTR